MKVVLPYFLLLIQMMGFLTVLRIDDKLLCLNEKIGWRRRYSNNNGFDNSSNNSYNCHSFQIYSLVRTVWI